ncbi:MAG: OmpH family outer membrane protein [Deltaproteobacteria bacterium]|nr:OmpH family outer membrane protein [Deltaproteobacteria bacterium]MBK8719919.1 OmpH family outer membrane protein [Deltaproteobacteria bacterium]
MQRFARLALPALLLPAMLFGAGKPAAAAVPTIEKVAVVDLQRCLLDTKEGKTAKTTLEAAFSRGQARLTKKAEALQQHAKDLQAKGAMLSKTELQKRQEDLMREQAELEQLSAELQEDVAQKEGLLTEKIYGKVAAIAKQIAIEEGVQIVLVKSEMTVLYADPKLDLTNRVIVRHDKEHK